MARHHSEGSHRRYRKENEIIERILVFVRERSRAKKTHIMYAANLNTVSLERFLDRLIEIGALREVEEGGHVTYVITRKGEQLLALLRGVRSLMSSSTSFSGRVEKCLEDAEGIEVVRNREVIGRSGVVYRLGLVMKLSEGLEFVVDIIEPGTDLTEGVLRVAKIAFQALDTGLVGLIVMPTEFVRFITIYYSGEKTIFGASMIFVYFSGVDTPESVARRMCEVGRRFAGM